LVAASGVNAANGLLGGLLSPVGSLLNSGTSLVKNTTSAVQALPVVQRVPGISQQSNANISQIQPLITTQITNHITLNILPQLARQENRRAELAARAARNRNIYVAEQATLLPGITVVSSQSVQGGGLSSGTPLVLPAQGAQYTSGHNGNVDLRSGQIFLSMLGRRGTATVNASDGTRVLVKKSATALIRSEQGITQVVNSSGLGRTVIVIPASGQPMALDFGREFISSAGGIAGRTVRLSDDLARRNVAVLRNGQLATSEIDLSTLLGTSQALAGLRGAVGNTVEGALSTALMKSAAIQQLVRGTDRFALNTVEGLVNNLRSGELPSLAGLPPTPNLPESPGLPGLPGFPGAPGGTSPSTSGITPTTQSATTPTTPAVTQPTTAPTTQPTTQPTAAPTIQAALPTTTQPTTQPTLPPATAPSQLPSTRNPAAAPGSSAAPTPSSNGNLAGPSLPTGAARLQPPVIANRQPVPYGTVPSGMVPPGMVPQGVAQGLPARPVPGFAPGEIATVPTGPGGTAKQKPETTAHPHAGQSRVHQAPRIRTYLAPPAPLPWFLAPFAYFINGVPLREIPGIILMEIRRYPRVAAAVLALILLLLFVSTRLWLRSHRLAVRLAAANEALLVARDQALATSRALSEFIAMITHEIRTTVTIILGLVAMLSQTKPTPEQQDLLNMLKGAGNSLMAIIVSVLDYSKVEAGRLTLESVRFSPADVITELTQQLLPSASEKGLDLPVHIDGSLPARVVGDPVRFRQIVSNLLVNAIKFTERGSVSLTATATVIASERAMVTIKVKDTGVGIAPEDLEKVFQPFVQAGASTTRRFGGTGLGLPISRSLARLMGGDVEVESVQGAGSEFSVHVPFDVEPETAAAAVAKPHPSISGVGRRILVAEDSPVLRMIIQSQLTKLGYTVELVSNGRQALEAAQIGKYDLIFMDWRMPIMDGLGATRAIRSLAAENGNVPIVAMTASALEEDRVECIKAGCNDYLGKPFSPDQLESVLERWISQ
jgi:signal transduction histidine kinase